MISLILPVYNEKENLSRNIKKVMDELGEAGQEFEIIIAEDGSTDGTYAIAKRLEVTHDNIRLSHSGKRLGKGLAIKNALSLARGDRVCYLDIDLSSDITALKGMVRFLDTYDIVIGSRLVRRNLTKRNKKRYLLSVTYNLIIRCLFRSVIMDHQCGFKAFRKAVILDLSNQARNNRWFFDTEILVIAQRLGYSIKEIPVAWKEDKKGKIRVNRVILQMIIDILRGLRL